MSVDPKSTSGALERSDDDIAEAVRQSLERDVLVSHERLQTSVSDGVVTIQGTVDYLSQYEDALACVRGLEGVRGVNGLIAVDPARPRLAPLAVRCAIERALDHHAEDVARRVQISLKAGKVTLTGNVPTQSACGAVEEAVRRTPGVLKVDNQLLPRA